MSIVLTLNTIALCIALATTTGLFVHEITVDYEKIKHGENSKYFKKIKWGKYMINLENVEHSMTKIIKENYKEICQNCPFRNY